MDSHHILKIFRLTVKEGSAPKDDVEGDVRIRFIAAGIEDDVSLNDQFDKVPFTVGNVVGQVAFWLIQQIHLISFNLITFNFDR